MKYTSNKAFTLVELLVVITIMMILTLSAYAPYQLYQSKQKVRNSAKIVTQTLYEARNMAINGVSDFTSGENLDIGVLFREGENKLVLYQRKYSETTPNTNPYTELKQIPLAQSVLLTSVESAISGFITFDSISGKGNYYTDETIITLLPVTGNVIDIQMGLQGATSGIMTKTVDYYTKTYVADPR